MTTAKSLSEVQKEVGEIIIHENDTTPIWIQCRNPNHPPYQMSLADRFKKHHGCEQCAEDAKKTTLKTKHPEIADELIETDSGETDPSKVAPSSREKAKFRCTVCDHVSHMPVRTRVRRTLGCGECKKRGIKNFKTLAGNAAAEFERANPGKFAVHIDLESTELHAFQCSKGHEVYFQTPADRIAGKRCPTCIESERIVQSIVEKNPRFAKEFISTKSGITDPNKVSAALRESATWKCEICKKPYEKLVLSRMRTSMGCDHCRKEGLNTLQAAHLYASAEFERANPGLYAADIPADSTKKVAFQCSHGHPIYHRSPVERIAGHMCPVCSFTQEGYSVADANPRFAQEFISTKSGITDPAMVRATSREEATWKCKVCNEPYEQYVKGRMNGSVGCKHCKEKGIINLRTLSYVAAMEFERANPGLYAADVDLESEEKIAFQCTKKHAIYYCTVTERLNGHTCPECIDDEEEVGEMTTQQFIEGSKDMTNSKVQSLIKKEQDRSKKLETPEELLKKDKERYNQEVLKVSADKSKQKHARKKGDKWIQNT